MKLRYQPEQIFLPLLIVLVLSNCIIEHAESTERPNKPNVVLILTDDLGWQKQTPRNLVPASSFWPLVRCFY